MININFEKLYKDVRINEPCSIAVPFKKGELKGTTNVRILDNNKVPVKSQSTITATWDDGSVKWLFTRFFATLPGNDKTTYFLDTNCTDSNKANQSEVICINSDNSIKVNTGAMSITLSTHANTLFDNIEINNSHFSKDAFSCPNLNINDNDQCSFCIDHYVINESGPVATIITGYGHHISDLGLILKVEIRYTFFYDKEYFEMAYRLINSTDNAIKVNSLILNYTNPSNNGKSAVATSNYRTLYNISDEGNEVSQVIDSDYLIYDANEHMSETFYGTFFADVTPSTGSDTGVTITHFQAYQNYPKALSASKEGIIASIIPPDVTDIVFQSGMARQQKMLLHFHDCNTPYDEINRISSIYQMPDRPYIDKSFYRDANVFEDIFYDTENILFESHIISKADSHARCYGLLNWGDAPDPGYTSQGRGHGEPVWTNNEYDYPHQCALLYSRTGTRRFLDYMLISAEHWMDVDICHYSNDPLLMDGQWMHTNNHCLNSKIVCSHEWVEGLLDYYHFTGDSYALNCALKIGDNIMRLLETDTFKQKGETNARETGWALRSMVALYKETFDKKWLSKCDWIVGHFREWEETYGHWLALYMDTVTIRVPFMISIAICSLMRYYRINKSQEIKDMIIRSMDDLIENCYMNTGVFLYKELPSLSRLGNNTIILEALTYTYELTGDSRYLTYGITTFLNTISSAKGGGGAKKVVKDSVIVPGPGTKNFAQSHLPLTVFYKALCDAGMTDMIK